MNTGKTLGTAACLLALIGSVNVVTAQQKQSGTGRSTKIMLPERSPGETPKPTPKSTAKPATTATPKPAQTAVKSPTTPQKNTPKPVAKPTVSPKASAAETTLTVRVEEFATSGSVPALKPTPKPIYTPVPTPKRNPIITKPPQRWRATPQDPYGIRGWFSLPWSLTEFLPQTQTEWDAWAAEAHARRVARLQTILNRREAFVKLYLADTADIIQTLYILTAVNRGGELFADRTLGVLQEAALRTQLGDAMEQLQPAIDRTEETRAALAQATDTHRNRRKVVEPSLRLNTAPSRWWLASHIMKLVEAQRHYDPSELIESYDEAILYEKLIDNRLTIGVGNLYNIDPGTSVSIPAPFVPYGSSMIRLPDGELPVAAPRNEPFTPPKLQRIEYTTTTENASVVNVSPGTVDFAGPLEHLGIVVIISHEGNLYSIFSKLSQTVVNRGQKITTGDVIGQAGTLFNGRYGCRFEVRKNDKSTTVTDLKEFTGPDMLLQ